MADDSKPVEEVDPTKADEVEADVEAGNAQGEPEKADEPKPGTPDKALQRMQQELGNVTRQLAELTQKANAGRELSEADKAKLERAQARIAAIKEAAGDPLAEHVLELTDKVGEQDTLKAQLAKANERLAALEYDRNWTRAREKYNGLDVNAIWSKALDDANSTLGDVATPTAVERLASRWFEERCDAAKKRMKEKDDAKGPANNKTAPSTYRVGSGNRSAPQLSDEDETLALARGLIIET